MPDLRAQNLDQRAAKRYLLIAHRMFSWGYSRHRAEGCRNSFRAASASSRGCGAQWPDVPPRGFPDFALAAIVRLTLARFPRSCQEMRRGHPSRLNAWQLGLLVLGWYALVFQTVLPQARMGQPVGLDRMALAALCSDGAGSGQQSPVAPGHRTCDCLFHCTGLGGGLAPRTVALAEKSSRPLVAGLSLQADQFVATVAIAGAPVRGPPLVDPSIV